ncbi:MAG: hypothetical protein RL062_1218 [Bacteroidota bacterium]|jgi:hypothetical protein
MKATWVLLANDQIDRSRWDACVMRHQKSLFSLSWYWDAVFPHWSGYVLGDYESVIPWPKKLKWGFLPVLKTPLYVKWLEGDSVKLDLEVQRFFGVKKIHLGNSTLPGKKRVVQLLELDVHWTRSKELEKNYRRCVNHGGQYVEHVAWNAFEQMMLRYHPFDWKGQPQAIMRRLFENSSALGFGKIVGVKVGEEWAALQFVIEKDGEMCLIQNVVPSDLRHTAGMTLLLIELFERALSNQKSIRVNFMGSENENVAKFNRKFGAVDRDYSEIQ